MKISISGFENVYQIKSIEIVTALNSHSRACFNAVVKSDDISDYVFKAQNHESVTISYENKVIFKGRVYFVEIVKSVEDIVISVSLKSSSVFSDEALPEKIRLFQDTKKTTKKIIEYINDNTSWKNDFQFDIDSGCDGLDKEVDNVIYQNKDITDYRFIKYLVNERNLMLVPDISSDKLKIKGITDNVNNYVTIGNDYEKDAQNITINCGAEENIVEFTSLQEYLIGECISFDDKLNIYENCFGNTNYYITEVKIMNKLDYIIYSYKATTNLQVYHDNIFKSMITTTATVKENKDDENKGRLQLSFTDYEDVCDDGNEYKADYLTTYVGTENNGMIMLPDKEDVVQTVIADGRIYIVGSVRNSNIGDKYQDVGKKYFVFKTDKVICFSEDEILVSYDEKVSGSFKADSIKFNYNDKTMSFIDDEIKIDYNEKVNLSLKSDIIKLNCTDDSVITIEKDKIKISQKEREIVLDKDVNISNTGSSKLTLKKSDLKIDSGRCSQTMKNGKVEISGMKINLKA